jgi:hypothetical protein
MKIGKVVPHLRVGGERRDGGVLMSDSCLSILRMAFFALSVCYGLV